MIIVVVMRPSNRRGSSSQSGAGRTDLFGWEDGWFVQSVVGKYGQGMLAAVGDVAVLLFFS